jgi:hypothetical protein
LQNATVRRTVQMLENLFKEYGKNVYYAGKTLSTFWDVKSMSSVKEMELRDDSTLGTKDNVKAFIR